MWLMREGEESSMTVKVLAQECVRMEKSSTEMVKLVMGVTFRGHVRSY